MRLGPHPLPHIPPYQADQRDPQEYRWDRRRKGALKQALSVVFGRYRDLCLAQDLPSRLIAAIGLFD
jgi:hypothetical protein